MKPYKSSENIIIIDKFVDTQELIIISDVLIIDCSTIYFDFIVTQKSAKLEIKSLTYGKKS